MGASKTALLGIGTLSLLVILSLMLYYHWEPSKKSSKLESNLTALWNDTGESARPSDEKTKNLTITIVYDNNEYDQRLDSAWGFSCLVKGLDKTILFDTGGDSSKLLSNMQILGISPGDVDTIVISHIHQDHVGGMSGFLQINSNVTVYLPAHFPDSLKNIVTVSGAKLVEVTGAMKICEDVYSTGELGTFIKEQSLIIDTSKGLVVITGCAHPGIVEIVRQAKKQLQGEVRLAIGGFHLCWMNSLKIKGIADGMKKEGVEKVAPCHCSGDLARRTFEKVYGENFILVGVGRRLEI